MKYFILPLAVFMLAACEPRYRYPCQNPDNWGTPDCQKPKCEIGKDCPEHIFKDDFEIDFNKNVKQNPQAAVKGEKNESCCKAK